MDFLERIEEVVEQTEVAIFDTVVAEERLITTLIEDIQPFSQQQHHHHSHHHQQHHFNEDRQRENDILRMTLAMEAEQERVQLQAQQQAQLQSQLQARQEARINEEHRIARLQKQREADSIKRIAREKAWREQQAQEEARALEEKQRLDEQKRVEAAEQARLQALQEEKAETNREAIYDAHTVLLDNAMILSHLELQKHIDALAPLVEPIARYQQTLKKGIPNTGEITLFYAIVKNANLLNEQKIELILKLLREKGYVAYIHLLFSTPIFEMLTLDLNINTLLRVLYVEAIRAPLVFNPSIESLIWAAFEKNKIIQEILQDSIALDQQMLSSSYAISSSNSSSFLHSTARAYLRTYVNGWASIYNAYLNLNIPTDKMIAFFDEWAQHATGANQFVDCYLHFLSLGKAETIVSPTTVQCLFILGEAEVIRSYNQLVEMQYPHTVLLDFLAQWLEAYPAPHHYEPVKQFYIQLVVSKALKNIEPNEERIWQSIISSDKKFGLALFQDLMNHGANKIKLLKFFECWVATLANDVESIQAYKSVKALLPYSALQPFRDTFRKIAEFAPQDMLAKGKPLQDERATLKWLKHSRPTLFGLRCATTKKPSYDVCVELKDQVPGARGTLDQAKHLAEKKFNKNLKEQGESAEFKFKRR